MASKVRPIAAIIGAAALSMFLLDAGARADVVRVSVLSHGSKANYETSAKDLPAVLDLMKKAPGFKSGYAISDDAKFQEGTVSVWESQDQIKAFSETAEWKKLMSSGPEPTSVDVRFFTVRP